MSWRSISTARFTLCWLFLAWGGFCLVTDSDAAVRASVSRSGGATAYKYYPPGGTPPSGSNDYYGNTPQGSATKTYNGWGQGDSANDSVPVGTKAPVPLREAAGAVISLVGAVGRGALAHPAVQLAVASCLAACPAIADWLSDAGVEAHPDGSLTSGGAPEPQLYYVTYYADATGHYATISAAIAAITASFTSIHPACTVTQVTGDGSSYGGGIQVARAQYGGVGGCGGYNGIYQHSAQGCPTGYTLEAGQCYPANYTPGPATPEQATQLVQAVPRTAQQLKDIARELDDYKALPSPQTLTATGPAEIDGGTQVQTHPDGSRTETTTKHKVDYVGDTVKIQTETTTKNFNPQNELTSTQTSTAPAEVAPQQIPDDYAREVTLQSILDQIKNRQASAGNKECTVAPTCSGDPISCAMIAQAWNQSCAWKDAPPTDEVSKSEVNVDTLVGTLNRTRYSAGLTCPPDIVVPTGVVGNVTIPMQPACNQAALIRPVVIALGVIVAAFIVMGAKEA